MLISFDRQRYALQGGPLGPSRSGSTLSKLKIQSQQAFNLWSFNRALMLSKPRHGNGAAADCSAAGGKPRPQAEQAG